MSTSFNKNAVIFFQNPINFRSKFGKGKQVNKFFKNTKFFAKYSSGLEKAVWQPCRNGSSKIKKNWDFRSRSLNDETIKNFSKRFSKFFWSREMQFPQTGWRVSNKNQKKFCSQSEKYSKDCKNKKTFSSTFFSELVDCTFDNPVKTFCWNHEFCTLQFEEFWQLRFHWISIFPANYSSRLETAVLINLLNNFQRRSESFCWKCKNVGTYKNPEIFSCNWPLNDEGRPWKRTSTNVLWFFTKNSRCFSLNSGNLKKNTNLVIKKSSFLKLYFSIPKRKFDSPAR